MRIIAGPCQHEGLAQSAEIARECKRVCDKYGIESVSYTHLTLPTILRV